MTYFPHETRMQRIMEIIFIKTNIQSKMTNTTMQPRFAAGSCHEGNWSLFFHQSLFDSQVFRNTKLLLENF